MGMGKGQDQKPPPVAGLDEIDIPTNVTDQPVTYFAGVRKLNVSWIMDPLITQIVPVDTGGKKG